MMAKNMASRYVKNKGTKENQYAENRLKKPRVPAGYIVYQIGFVENRTPPENVVPHEKNMKHIYLETSRGKRC